MHYKLRGYYKNKILELTIDGKIIILKKSKFQVPFNVISLIVSKCYFEMNMYNTHVW